MSVCVFCEPTGRQYSCQSYCTVGGLLLPTLGQLYATSSAAAQNGPTDTPYLLISLKIHVLGIPWLTPSLFGYVPFTLCPPPH